MATREKTRCRVAHSSPGRVRLRVHHADRSPRRMEEMRERLQAQPDIHAVEVNARTGSVLVRGESTEKIKEALLQFVEPIEEAGPERLPEATAVELIKGFNSRLSENTQGRFTLSWAVPALFLGFGLRQLLLGGLTIGTVPWYVLMYYGVDSFIKLNPQHAPRVEPVGAQPGPSRTGDRAGEGPPDAQADGRPG
jgi:Heavy metal associated domain 2